MKKTLSLLMLLLVLSTFVFASHRLAVSFAPFAFQNFVQKNEGTKNAVNSKYGIGGGVGYYWEFDEGFNLGADIKADTYMLEGQNNFTDISLLAKFGYIAKVSDMVGFYANMKAGLDFQAVNEKTSAVLEFGPEFGVEFKFNEHFDLFASCEGLFGFPKNGNVRYSEFRVTPAVGAGYNF